MIIDKKTQRLYAYLALGLLFLGGIGVAASFGNEHFGTQTVAAPPFALNLNTNAKAPEPLPVLKQQYIQVTEGCRINIDDTCLKAHAQPNDTAPVVAQLRVGIILKVAETISTENGVWFKIAFDEWLRYPERVSSDWYVPVERVRLLKDIGDQELTEETTRPSDKFVIVDRSDQKLYAYENDELFLEQTISTGILRTPTPRGTFEIYRKTPSRYMQGPLPGVSSKYYDLPGVPWNLYFTKQGGVIHGTYWHDQFGKPWSNGCVNVPTNKAEELYNWADIGTPVFVRD